MKKQNPKSLRAFLFMLMLMVSLFVPTEVSFATSVQQDTTDQNTETVSEEQLSGCVLDDGLTVFDTCPQTMTTDATSEGASQTQVVNEIVVFIAFADEGADIYEERGGMEYLQGQFEGTAKSLDSYVNEFSWGQVDANTYFWPQASDGTPICYVDEHPVSYYKTKSDSNPNGYIISEKSSRRNTLLNNAIEFMGSDFLEKLGIENEPYNLVFVVPDRENWNDLLWSHKSSTNVYGTYKTYNMITYPGMQDVSRTIAHEFMHSLGYPDLYHYSDKTSPTPVGVWSIMGSSGSNCGHPTVHEKKRYGNWITNEEAIQTITKSGHYVLEPATQNPNSGTIAYKIPIEGMTDKYFMIEYRGNENAGFDSSLSNEGLIFYRVDTAIQGNADGPPDEIFVLREDGDYIYQAYYDGTTNKTKFSEFKLYNDTTDFGINVYNIKKENGCMSFDISIPHMEFTVSEKSPLSVADTVELKVIGTAEDEEVQYRFGTIFNGKEIEFNNGYISSNSCNVSFGTILGTGNGAAVGTHTLFVDIKNMETGEVTRRTIKDYVVEGLKITSFKADKASPQKTGTAIGLSVEVENEATYRYNTYKFSVVKDGVETNIAPYSGVKYSATWTPKEPGKYTVKYYLRDNFGQEATAEMEYTILSEEIAFVYYNNASWNKANIHYKVGNGTWTTVPGVAMENSNIDGYTWCYAIDLGTASNATVCFNNGNNTWDNNGGKNYTVKKGLNGIGGQDLTFAIKSITGTPTKQAPCYSITLSGGIAPYTYSYEISDRATGDIISSDENCTLTGTYLTTPYGSRKSGKYTLNITFTDSIGQTVTASKDYTLEPFTISDITTSVNSPQLPNTEITLNAQYENPFIYKYGLVGNWTITNKTTNKTETFISYYTTELKWTPTEIGEYEITVSTTDNNSETATHTINYSVVDEIRNETTVYYSNSSWTQAYIHYKVGNGNWTTAPGVKMENNVSNNGYTWKYVIDLGDADNTTVCFNNGNGSWDSKNGSNYSLNAGSYGIKNQTTEELTEGLSVSVEITGTRGSSSAHVTVEDGVAPYTYSYVYTRNGENPQEITNTSSLNTDAITVTSYDGGSYKVDVVVTDAEGKVGTATTTRELPALYIASISSDVASPQKTGTTVTFTADIQSEYVYKFSNYRNWTISKDGVEYKTDYSPSNILTYTFEEEGTYDVTCTLTDASGQTAIKTVQFVVSDATNIATIYYNTTWSNAYIHYCVAGGNWTSVPGVAMTKTSEKTGYTHKYVIDLDKAENVVVCFNNGSGTWDSKNGSNYTINAGTYGVSNGNISKLQ